MIIASVVYHYVHFLDGHKNLIEILKIFKIFKKSQKSQKILERIQKVSKIFAAIRTLRFHNGAASIRGSERYNWGVSI